MSSKLSVREPSSLPSPWESSREPSSSVTCEVTCGIFWNEVSQVNMRWVSVNCDKWKSKTSRWVSVNCLVIDKSKSSAGMSSSLSSWMSSKLSVREPSSLPSLWESSSSKLSVREPSSLTSLWESSSAGAVECHTPRECMKYFFIDNSGIFKSLHVRS